MTHVLNVRGWGVCAWELHAAEGTNMRKRKVFLFMEELCGDLPVGPCRFPLSIVRTPQSGRHAERNFFSLYSQISLWQIFSRKLSEIFQKSLHKVP